MSIYMRKLDLDRHWFQVLALVVGTLILAVSLLADTFGWGGEPGFGQRQIMLAIVGSGMVLAAGLMLVARRRGWWEPQIPTLIQLQAQIYRRWLDLVLVVILSSVAGVASFQGGQLINPVVFTCDYESTWFHGDLTRVFHTMTGVWIDQLSESTHPLFALATYLPVQVLKIEMGIETITAVRMIVAAVATLWGSALFIVLRLVGCRPFDATLFTVWGLTSASAMFWLTVPETFGLGSLSILLTLSVVALAEYRGLSPLWYTVVSALTLGFTVTNWMAGIIATIANHSWKRSLQITLNALCLVLVLWEARMLILPRPQEQYASIFASLFRADESLAQQSQGLQKSGGPVYVTMSFIFHTMVMPSFEVADKSSRLDWPLMFTQFSLPGSGSLWGAVAVVLWVALLGLGVWALFSVERQRRLRIVLGVMLLGQLAQHMVFGEETFLYSIHFAPLLVIVVALSTLTRARPAALVLTGALVVNAGINNGLLFLSAAGLAQCIEGLVAR